MSSENQQLIENLKELNHNIVTLTEALKNKENTPKDTKKRNTLNETEERKLIEVCIANVDYVLKEVENEYQIAFSWRILESFTRRHLKK